MLPLVAKPLVRSGSCARAEAIAGAAGRPSRILCVMASHLPALPAPETMTEALAFKWVDGARSIWETQPELQHQSPVTLKYVGAVVRDGKPVGVFNRNVRARATGLEIEHITLNLEDAAKGHGFATAFWIACLDRYRTLGLERVTFIADSGGKLFWAREPVRFTDPGTPKAMLAKWVNPDQKSETGSTGFELAAARLGLPADETKQFVADVEADPAAFTPAGLYRTEIGRLLIGHPRCCLDRRREEGQRFLPGAGPKADQPVPAVVRCR